MSKYPLKLHKRHKSGLFLSIELIVVITVVITILVATVAGLIYLRTEYTAMKLVQEIDLYAEAMQNFQNTYGGLPGDIDPAVLNRNMEFAGSLAITTISSNNTGAIFGDRDIYYFADNNNKPYDVFRELALAKLIPTGLVKLDNVNRYAEAFSSANLGQKVVPVSTLDNGYIYGLLNFNTNFAGSKSRMLAWVTDSAMQNYWISWQDRPLLVLTGGNTNFKYPHFGDSTSVGAISASLASIVDLKMDDGLPMGSKSKLIAVDTRRSGGFGCTTASTTWTSDVAYSVANEAAMLALKYQTNDNDGVKGCHLVYRID